MRERQRSRGRERDGQSKEKGRGITVKYQVLLDITYTFSFRPHSNKMDIVNSFYKRRQLKLRRIKLSLHRLKYGPSENQGEGLN